MDDMMHHDTPRPAPIDKAALGQIVLVLQGGGALGAYQAGVYQALDEAGIEPDWVIGTSIGAINAALIAGNKLKSRLARLQQFWTRMRHGELTQLAATLPGWGAFAANTITTTTGVAGFFSPNPWAIMSGIVPMAPEAAAVYTTSPLVATLTELIDIDELNAGSMRLTVGAAHVQSGDMKYFDSRDGALTIKHVVASGALPPAFPAVRIDGELYWDGGILSNTPIEVVFDDKPRRSGLVFAVNIWSPRGPEPDSIQRVMARQKDLQFASRQSAQIVRQKQIHKLRHVIAELMARLPEGEREAAKPLGAYGCVTRMHVVRLLAPPVSGEDSMKDIDFSAGGIKARWDAGYADTVRVLAQQPWTHEFDPMEGFILHEAEAGTMMAEG